MAKPRERDEPTAEAVAVGDSLVLKVGGRWRLDEAAPSTARLVNLVDAHPAARSVRVEDDHLSHWDSSLILALARLRARCRQRRLALDLGGLPEGARRLLELGTAAPVEHRQPTRLRALEAVGQATVGRARGYARALSFLGEVALALGALAVGRAAFRPVDFRRAVQDCGAGALPIVSVVSLLVGLIFAFIGAVQLREFGASIYVANLVGLSMTREMAAVMTAVVLAGRTGAAFAAQIAAMRGNEEIDALVTLGLSPAEFLVLPRLLALSLMMPLLFVYSCFIGLVGGWLVGSGMLHLTPAGYLAQTRQAIDFSDFAIGLCKSVAFGLAVAYAGCLRGMEAGRSAAEVGAAATSAVVTAIVLIIVIDAVFAVLTDVMGL